MGKARRGVYAAAITPLAPDGGPDLPKLVGYCRQLLEEGLDGVAPAGTTGEGNSLPTAARLAMPAAFAEAGFAGDRVIFGTGACAAEDAVVLTRASLEAGFPNVLVLPPFYLKSVTDEGLFAYYARLIEGVGSEALRIYLYHFPQMSMTPISVDLVRRLKAAFGPVIAGLKDSSGQYEGSLAFAAAAEDFDVFPSDEGRLRDALSKGCGGVISATTNASAALAARTLASQGADAEALQQALAAVRRTIAKYPLSAALKRIEAWKSGDESWCRTFPPLVPLDPAQSAALRQDLAELGDVAAPLTASRQAA